MKKQKIKTYIKKNKPNSHFKLMILKLMKLFCNLMIKNLIIYIKMIKK